MNQYKIIVKQEVDDDYLCLEDKTDNPIGDWYYWGLNEESAIDQFHDNVPIKNLGNFNIRVDHVQN